MCLIIININPVYELMIFNHHGNGSTFNHSSFLSIAAHSRYDCNYLYRLPFVWFQCYGPARSVIMPLFTKFSMEFHMNSQKMWSNILSFFPLFSEITVCKKHLVNIPYAQSLTSYMRIAIILISWKLLSKWQFTKSTFHSLPKHKEIKS